MDQLKEKVRLTFQKVTQFLKDALAELKKVTWPTPKQAMASTAVVIVLVFLFLSFSELLILLLQK